MTLASLGLVKTTLLAPEAGLQITPANALVSASARTATASLRISQT